ncbi:MAG: HAD family hydrolase [Microbacteriaceae bacterium]|nr:HAD family hydrolase [Microbacteriaceae bacterium]
MPRTLILDLDGTLCLGDAPIRRVADHAFSRLGAGAGERAAAVLGRFLAGEHQLLPAARDGYDAVALLATEAGARPEDIHAAFMATRAPEEIDRWLPEVHAPAALVAALGELDGVERVLVTNSPRPGMTRIVETLGLATVLDDVVTSARKPNGMPQILDRLGVGEHVDATALAAIGDRWANDLSEVHMRGGTTFHIAHDGWADGAPTFRAGEPDEHVGALLEWWRAGRRVSFV